MVFGTERQWFLPVFLLVGLLCLIFVIGKLSSPADIRAELRTGTGDGILIIPVQIDRDNYGIAMIDTVGQTLWVYELSGRGPNYNRLKLLAARSWQYDKLLQQYNTAEPKPEQVKALLENLEKGLQEQGGAKQTTSEENVPEKSEPNSGN